MDLQERLKELYELYAEELAEARAQLKDMSALEALDFIKSKYEKSQGEC